MVCNSSADAVGSVLAHGELRHRATACSGSLHRSSQRVVTSHIGESFMLVMPASRPCEWSRLVAQASHWGELSNVQESRLGESSSRIMSVNGPAESSR